MKLGAMRMPLAETPEGFLSESGTGNWISSLAGFMRLEGAVVWSKHEKIVASAIALAEVTLSSLKKQTNPWVRLIVDSVVGSYL